MLNMLNLSKQEKQPDILVRDPQAFSCDQYDLIIVGGGIYGVTLALEASRRRLTCLLLERDDFGSQTSFNHLRILHGGLRYLQNLDLRRFRDSVGERSWFLRQFPDITRPLDCLMPLSGQGLKRPFFMRLAFLLDTVLAWDHNRTIPQANRLSRGRVLSIEELQRRFPEVLPDQVGAALWQDGFAPDSPRLLIELLRWACAYGARALNYCGAEELLTAKGKVVGMQARDSISGMSLGFKAPLVINAAGPWSRSLAESWHGNGEHVSLFPHRILVWNLLFHRPPLAKMAVALTPPAEPHTYFAVPWKNRLLVGTAHRLLQPEEHRPPTNEEIGTMIEHLNSAVPGANLKYSEIKRILWGVMPGTPDCLLAKRPVFQNHGRNGGPEGLISVSGVKFTTARQVADQLFKEVMPAAKPCPYGKSFTPSPQRGRRGFDTVLTGITDWRQLAEDESAQTLADLILRRSALADEEMLDSNLLSSLAPLFSADPEIQRRQINEVLCWSNPEKIRGVKNEQRDNKTLSSDLH